MRACSHIRRMYDAEFAQLVLDPRADAGNEGRRNRLARQVIGHKLLLALHECALHLRRLELLHRRDLLIQGGNPTCVAQIDMAHGVSLALFQSLLFFLDRTHLFLQLAVHLLEVASLGVAQTLLLAGKAAALFVADALDVGAVARGLFGLFLRRFHAAGSRCARRPAPCAAPRRSDRADRPWPGSRDRPAPRQRSPGRG